MAKNQDALFRRWHMLRLVPRYPRKITVQDVCRQLAGAGFEITQRSVQRDLNDLSDVFPLYCDDREKPFGWSWQKDAASFDLPGLSVPEALALAMAERYLHDLLPSSMIDGLQPHFKAARKRLGAEPKPDRSRSWLDKVITVPATQPLLPPKIDREVQSVVSEALLRERQVSIRYRRRADEMPVEYRIHPLALIQRGPMLYLYCRIFDYEDARTLAVNRIISAQLLEDKAVYPDGFSADQVAEAGVWGFGSGETIQLELVFQHGYGEHLYETPLSKDQEIEELADGLLSVTATVPDTPQLRWWLLGFGGGVEVSRPKKLRGGIVAVAKELADTYGKDCLSTKEEETRLSARLNSLKTVLPPPESGPVSANEALAIALVENINRENPNPIAEAIGLQRLIDECGMTPQQAADAVGRSIAAASNLLCLLQLSKSVQEMLMADEIETGHARALLSLPIAEQERIAKLVIKKSYSVRITEKLVVRSKNSAERIT